MAAAAQRFYLNHDDNYDFLVLFNNFSLVPGNNAFAYEMNVRNEVLGIGSLLADNPLLDFGLQFGSRRRLASFLNMGPLSNYPSDPAQKILGLGENNTLSVMGQEAGHRFLAYVQVIDPVSSLPSRELLGRDFAHWSFFYNSEASVVEGNRIEDRGSGVTPRFLTVEAVTHYSPLDQYIMGLRAPEEVPPSFVVVNSSAPFSPSSPPTVGVSFNGERRNIPLDLIVADEGPRVPESAVSQKRFTFAFVLLVRDGTTPSAAGYPETGSHTYAMADVSSSKQSTIGQRPTPPSQRCCNCRPGRRRECCRARREQARSRSPRRGPPTLA